MEVKVFQRKESFYMENSVNNKGARKSAPHKKNYSLKKFSTKKVGYYYNL